MAAATANGPRRVWQSLGTPVAVRAVVLLVLIYAVVIGALFVGYVKVQSCVTKYSNEAAVSTKARADAAAEDRRLNVAESALEDSDRAALRANATALTAVLQATVTRDEPRVRRAFTRLLSTQQRSATALDGNEVKRREIRRQRAEIEARRAQSPPPPPPSETC